MHLKDLEHCSALIPLDNWVLTYVQVFQKLVKLKKKMDLNIIIRNFSWIIIRGELIMPWNISFMPLLMLNYNQVSIFQITCHQNLLNIYFIFVYSLLISTKTL